MMYQSCCKAAIGLNSKPGSVGPDGATKCPICLTDLRRVRFLSQLQIGDIIRPGFDADNGYADCTVYNVDDKNVYVFRPYVHTADFIGTGGAITYLGSEYYSMPIGDGTVQLLARRPPEETRDKIKLIHANLRKAIEGGQTAKALELLRSL